MFIWELLVHCLLPFLFYFFVFLKIMLDLAKVTFNIVIQNTADWCIYAYYTRFFFSRHSIGLFTLRVKCTTVSRLFPNAC